MFRARSSTGSMPEIAGHQIHGPFPDEHGLGLAEPAVGARGGGVGGDDGGLGAHRVPRVATGQHAGQGEQRTAAEVREVGAGVAHRVGPQAPQPTVAVEGRPRRRRSRPAPGGCRPVSRSGPRSTSPGDPAGGRRGTPSARPRTRGPSAPKPPPTSGATTRMRCRGRPVTTARVSRTAWGAWLEVHTVSRPSPSGTATTPLGSIGAPVTRPMSRRNESLRSAAANTASVCSAVSPTSNRHITLSARSG